MRAAIFHAPGQPLAISDVPDPEPGAGEVVIKIARCGVCGTDLHATSGHGYTFPPGSQIGHEYAGEIVALGKAVERLKIGDKVAAMPVVGCGHCDYCRTGVDVLCRSFRGYGAGAAEYARIDARGATLLPQTVSLADGALVEPLAVGRRGVRLAAPNADTKALVIGPGPIGLATIFWLRRAGVRRVAVLSTSARRQVLAEKMGAEQFVVEGENASEQIISGLGGSPDLVMECAGVPGVLGRAIELVRPQGHIVALGFCMVPDSIVPGAALMKDVSLRFSVTYTRDDYAECAEALADDGDRARGMVTDTVSLAEFPGAFEAFRDGTGGLGKLVVDPWA
jgi:(R,R)-butanediol dehydrogenase/meso-butanediol dehydrogenase/diacetyl reductase